jgi:tetratricopeptide (TPR) repeat protein
MAGPVFKKRIMIKRTTYLSQFLLASLLMLLITSCGMVAGESTENAVSDTQKSLEIPDMFQRKGELANASEWQKTQQKVEELKSKIAKKPDDVKARLQIATIYISEARITGEHPYYYPAIHKILDGALSMEPNNFEAIVLKASVYLSQHRFQDAKQLAEKAQKINPSNAFVYGILVDANVELGNYKDAIAASDKMQTLKPSLESYSRASYLREIHGDFKGAIEAMKLAVQAGLPGSEPQCWSRNTLADLYLRTGQLDKAEEQFKVNLVVRPSYAFSMGGLAKVEEKRGNHDKALQLLDSASAILPEFSFHEQMADIYAAQGNREKAMAKYDEVLKMLEEDEASGHTVALEKAKLYTKMEKFAEAEKYVQQEYKLRPNNIDVNKEYAAILYKKNDSSKAKEHMRLAKVTNSKDPELLELDKKIASM